MSIEFGHVFPHEESETIDRRGHPEQLRRFTGEVLPLLRERGLVRSE